MYAHIQIIIIIIVEMSDEILRNVLDNMIHWIYLYAKMISNTANNFHNLLRIINMLCPWLWNFLNTMYNVCSSLWWCDFISKFLGLYLCNAFCTNLMPLFYGDNLVQKCRKTLDTFPHLSWLCSKLGLILPEWLFFKCYFIIVLLI